MLAARRDLVVADVMKGARELRYAELENIVQRYTSIITVMSLSAGFAFDAMVELDVDPDDLTDIEGTMATVRREEWLLARGAQR